MARLQLSSSDEALEVLQEPKPETLLNIASFSDACADQVEVAGAITPLVACLQSGSHMVQRQAVRAFATLAWQSHRAAAIIAAGSVAPLVSCLSSISDWVHEHAAEVLQLLLRCGEDTAALVASAGAARPLVACLSSRSEWAQLQSAAALAIMPVDSGTFDGRWCHCATHQMFVELQPRGARTGSTSAFVLARGRGRHAWRRSSCCCWHCPPA